MARPEQLIHDLLWSLQQGELHRFLFADGITFATWGLVVATALLVYDSWQKRKEDRESEKRESARRNAERKELEARWEREDELRSAALKESILGELYAEFSSSEMRSARTNYAHNLFKWPNGYHSSMGPTDFACYGPGLALRGERLISDFFAEVERRVNVGELEVSAIDRKFGDYIYRFVEISGYRVPGQLDAVRSLWQKVKAYRLRVGKPEPSSDIESKKSYWYHAIERDLLPNNC
jgi:hypothetical protein